MTEQTNRQQTAAATPQAAAPQAAPAPEKPSSVRALAKRGILQFNVTDEKMLFACYMPFVKGCGLFIPSNGAHKIGEEVFLLLGLPGEGGKFSVAAKVVWLNPLQKMGKRVPGIGLQVMGREADRLHDTIETILGKKVSSPLPTATM